MRTTHVEAWLAILGGASLVGGLSGWYLRGGFSWAVGLLLPPSLFLSLLLVEEYLVPYQGGGASMWPIAFIVGGTAAVLASCSSLLVFRAVRRRRDAGRLAGQPARSGTG